MTVKKIISHLPLRLQAKDHYFQSKVHYAGLSDVPLGLGETAEVRTPVQAKMNLADHCLFLQREKSQLITRLCDNMVSFYPLYLDEGELTFGLAGEIISPITKVKYTGFQQELTVDFSLATSYDQPFAADVIRMDIQGSIVKS